MITVIFRRDFRGFLRKERLSRVGGLALVLLLSSLAVGWRYQAEAALEREAAVSH
jgi:hypothetical protein